MYPLGTLGLLIVCDHNVFSMCPVGIGPLVPSGWNDEQCGEVALDERSVCWE